MESFGNILLIRHAETQWNISWKIGYTGESDVLTEKGINQAQLLGNRLSYILRQHGVEKKVIIYLSETRRTRQTAHHAWLLWSYTDFCIDPALNEIHMWSLLDQDISLSKRDLFCRVIHGYDTSFPGWESVQDVQKRVLPFLQSRDPEALHVCFTHGISIASILRELVPDEQYKPSNASVTRLHIDHDGKLQFVSYQEVHESEWVKS